ncbi:MAG: NADH-quinone oxidoreductase subunit L [Acidobacteriota bacterium]
MMEQIWLIPFFPLLGFLINGILARRYKFSEKLIGSIAAGMIALSFLVSVGAVIQYASWSHENHEKPYIAKTFSYTWIPGGKALISEGKYASQRQADFTISWSYQLDHLSGLYILFVTFVGFLIHVFAIGYMHGEDGFARFFAYLNLFMFMMLTLVLGSNLLMLFVGWEGVGLCSYLLIGYYMTREEAAAASKKAFIVNRIGDFGFALAILGLFATFGTIQYDQINLLISEYPVEALGAFGLMSWIALGLFVGATGKSAQIPLYIWLPDAMAGPTPVSALIHAATMVTAGVYMVTRMNAVFQRSLTIMMVVAIIGCATAFVAATIGVTQNDIKKVLAYSTVSQLGYMFLACGVGAFIAGIFHVVTHAFFKAQLFLGSGSVIHGMHHEQDMRHMGGLKKYMPQTFKTMAISWLAICGIFPLAGFWSKDEILGSALSTHIFGHSVVPYVLFGVGLLTAGMTAFYMTRLMGMTFMGKERFLGATAHDGGHEAPVKTEAHGGHTADTGHGHGHGTHKPHESPSVMTIPLWILAGLAILGGLVLGVPPGAGLIDKWLHPVIDTTWRESIDKALPGFVHTPHEFHLFGIGGLLMVVSSLVALAGIGWAFTIYFKDKLQVAEGWANKLGPIYQLSYNKWYWDYLLDVKFVDLMKKVDDLLWGADRKVVDGMPNGTAFLTRGTSLLSGWWDRYVVDLLVNLVGWMTRAGSVLFRTLQTGFLNNYALVMVLGISAILIGLEYKAVSNLLQRIYESFGGGAAPPPSIGK